MTIGEFSEATGIVESTLRYYEKKNLIRVERDSANRRVYSNKDITWVQFIQKLKNTGMLLRDIQRYSNLRYQGDKTMEERLKMLKKHKIYVEEQCRKWNQYSKNLDEKMAFYRGAIAKLQEENLKEKIS